MSLVVRDNPATHRYEILDGVHVVGSSEYERSEGSLDFVHTETDPAHAGKGLARTLVSYALDDARAHGLTVVPHCSYVRKFIADHPDQYLDLVPVDVRVEFGLA